MRKRMSTFTFRISDDLSNKLRGISVVYGELPGQFVRDMLEAVFDAGGLRTQLFQQRLAHAMAQYQNKEVVVPGASGGTWSKPRKPAKVGTKGNRRRKEPPVP
jgi:hypothetical protein